MDCRFLVSLWLAAVLSLAGTESLRAEIRQKTIEKQYRVWGKTAADIAAYMRDRPFRGDYGPAIANIRPRYSFNAKTQMVKGMCRVAHFRMQIDFTLTLPYAVDRKSFDRKTEQAWRSLESFMRRHELVHRRNYLSCAEALERKVMKLSTANCFELERKIAGMVRENEKACEMKQRAFDSRELPKLTNHRFFKQARAERDRIQRRIKAQFEAKGGGS